MGIDNKDEVFEYFRTLSGAKRIEVLSGIVHSCIPLELRFLATLVESLARKDYVSLLEDEHKANSFHELQTLCSTDLLADISPFIRFPGVIQSMSNQGRPPAPMSPNHTITSSGQSDNGSDDGRIKITISGMKSTTGSNDKISPPPMLAIPDVVNVVSTAATPFGQPRIMNSIGVHGAQTQQPLVNLGHGNPSNPNDNLLPNPRTKVVVYLCLLNSTNRVAATILYDAFMKYLSADNFKKHLEICSMNIVGISIGNDDSNHNIQQHHQDANQPMVQGPSGMMNQMVPSIQFPIVDPQLIDQITLILTMAIYHPAFQFEQQSLLSQEYKKLMELFNNLSPSRINHQTQHGSMYIPSETFISNYSTHLHTYPTHPITVADCMNHEHKKSPPICCYNCGGKGHWGRECAEETLDEATRETNFQMNFKNPGPVIPVPTIMAQPPVMQISTTLPHQQPNTPPVPHSPQISNNRTNDISNGPSSVNNRNNAINATNVPSETTNNQSSRQTNDTGNYCSPSSSVNPIPGSGTGTGSRRAPSQLYVAPHRRNENNDQRPSPRHDGHNNREAPARIVRIHNSRSHH